MGHPGASRITIRSMGDRPAEARAMGPAAQRVRRVVLPALLLVVSPVRGQKCPSSRRTEALPLGPESRTDAISGIVRNEAGARISGATCEIYDDEATSWGSYELGEFRAQVVTGPDGV